MLFERPEVLVSLYFLDSSRIIERHLSEEKCSLRGDSRPTPRCLYTPLIELFKNYVNSHMGIAARYFCTAVHRGTGWNRTTAHPKPFGDTPLCWCAPTISLFPLHDCSVLSCFPYLPVVVIRYFSAFINYKMVPLFHCLPKSGGIGR